MTEKTNKIDGQFTFSQLEKLIYDQILFILDHFFLP